MRIFCWLGALAAGTVQDAPTPLKSADPAFELMIPAGYAPDATTTFKHYQRKAGSADWEKIRLRVRFTGDRTVQFRGALVAGSPTTVADPSGRGKSRGYFTPWNGVEIPATEKWYVENDLPMFSLVFLVPLRQQAVALEVDAVETLEKEARADLLGVLDSLKGKTDWLPTEKLRELESRTPLLWPVYAAAGLDVAFLVAWGVAFRTGPMRAHGLRTAWHFAVVLVLLVGFMKGDAFSGNHLLLLLLGPLFLFHLLMGIRRVKLGIELGD